MVTKRTGRPRGRPKRNFFKDRDRYRLARINALMDIHSLKFEPAARLALATAGDKPVSPSARTKRTHRKRLEKGWGLQSFERVKVIPERDSEIDTLRLKSKQYADDELAQRWLRNMSNAWFNLLQYERVGPPAELLVFKCAEAADESDYAKRTMLPLLRKLMSPD